MLGLRTPDAVGPAPSIPVPILEAKGTIIDLGCGSGRLLSALRANGLAAFGVERYAERAQLARRAGFEVFRGEISEPKPLTRGLAAAACLVSTLTTAALRTERTAIIDSLQAWLVSRGNVWVRDFEQLGPSHSGAIPNDRIEAYERRYAIGPTLASRIWTHPASDWVQGTFVAFHRGKHWCDWTLFEEHEYTVEQFISAMNAGVITVDFPACHLNGLQLVADMPDFSLISLTSQIAGSRSGVLLPVLDAIFQLRH